MPHLAPAGSYNDRAEGFKGCPGGKTRRISLERPGARVRYTGEGHGGLVTEMGSNGRGIYRKQIRLNVHQHNKVHSPVTCLCLLHDACLNDFLQSGQ